MLALTINPFESQQKIPVILSAGRATPLLRGARTESKDPENVSLARLDFGALTSFPEAPFNYSITKLRNHQIFWPGKEVDQTEITIMPKVVN